MLPVEVQRRDIDAAFRQADRVREIGLLAFLLKLGVRHDPDRAAGLAALDADDLTAAIRDADHAHLEIIGLRVQSGRQHGREARSPIGQ